MSPQPVRGAPQLLSKKHSHCKYPTESHPLQGTSESKDTPRVKQESVPPPSIYVLSKSTHALNMNMELQTTTSLHSVSTSALLDSGATGMFVNWIFVQKHKLETCALPNPVPIHNVDGTPNENGSITEEVKVILWYGQHTV